MPKMKTNRSASKRFKRTKSGKFKRSKAFGRHLMTAKSPKRRRNLRQSGMLEAMDAARVRRMLPNG
jgi:large subunit ribosomal protein L35